MMATPRQWKLAMAAIVAGMAITSLPLLARQDGPDKAATNAVAKKPEDNPPTTIVKPGKIRATITERGIVEFARLRPIANEVEGATTIIVIKPDGSKVRKGDLVVELDSGALRDNLVNQQ